MTEAEILKRQREQLATEAHELRDAKKAFEARMAKFKEVYRIAWEVVTKHRRLGSNCNLGIAELEKSLAATDSLWEGH